MMYRYTAYTEDRRIVRGTIESDNPEAAESSLYKAGFKRIMELEETRAPVNWRKLFSHTSKVSQQALMDFTNELSILIESGLTLLMALRQLEKQSTSGALRSIVSKLATDLQGGTPFHQALGMHPQVFSPTYCSIMAANEKAGTLDAGLKQISRQLKQQIATRAQIQRAITQPAIIVGLAIAVVILLTVVVLPPLAETFRQFGAELPWTTKFLIGLSDFVGSYLIAILIAIAVIVLITFIFLKQPTTKPMIDRQLLRVPLIGQVIIWHNTAQFSRTLSNLLGAGLLLPDSINILLRGVGNTHFQAALTDMRKRVVQGQSLSATMGQNKLFPPLLVEMVGVGESSGNLEYALGTVADYFEIKVENRITRLTSLLEPALTLGVGLVVGFITVSMISTIYGLMGSF